MTEMHKIYTCILQEKQVLKRAANYLNLNLRIRDVAGQGKENMYFTHDLI